MVRSMLLPAAVLAMLAACAQQQPLPDQDGGLAQAGGVQESLPAPAQPPAASGPGGLDDDPCDAAAAQSLVGQQASDEIIERARVAAGAGMARTLHPDQAVTMEYRAGRLNIDIDHAGVITGFRCG